MSASDKKKIRKEQSTDLLTEKQRQQKAEEKKLKLYTACFVVAMALVVLATLGIFVGRYIINSGIPQKNTVAVTIGDRSVSSAELNYYYVDAINNFYSDWYTQYQDETDSYLLMMGLDTSKPLNEQVFDQETGETWSQYFVDTAIAQAKSDFAMYDLAQADGFALPEDSKTAIETNMKNLETYATIYGYSNTDQYLRQVMYGYGSDTDSYRAYCERSEIANAYRNAHLESLIYEDDAIREYESDKMAQFNSYTYTTAYLSYTNFLKGGTEGEDGQITYSDEENEAARAAMKTAADELATATSVEDLKTKVSAIDVKEGSSIALKEQEKTLYSSVDTVIREWLTSADRKEGDITAIANTSTSEDADGKEVSLTNGYYIVIFHSVSDNATPMSNVRHLLVKFDGGEEDEETGEVLYSEEEKNAAKEKADGYLKTWKEGAATEDSFIELVKEHSDDSSAESGGLFEDIHPDSSYVANFLNWSIDAERKTGDAEVIETEYGYHVMYYVGADEMTYSDYMSTTEMRTNAQDEWYNGSVDAIESKEGNLSKLALDYIISAA